MGSPFSFVSEQIPMPNDPASWIKVRKLTGKQYEKAQDVHRAKFAVSSDRWAGFFRATATNPDSEDVQRILSDPMTGHDRYALAKEGLVEWSFERAIDDAAIDELDDDAIDFIAREVLKLAKPGLFAEKKSG